MVKPVLKTFAAVLLAAGVVSCSDDDPVVYHDVTINDVLPSDLPSGYTMTSGSITWTEVNTGAVYVTELTAPVSGPVAVSRAASYSAATDADGLNVSLPAGVYNVDGRMLVTDADGNTKKMRSVASSVEVKDDVAVSLNWFFYNPSSTLVFKEISVTGSRKATGTGALFDSFFTIYNNSDEEVVLTGVALCESALINNTTNLYDINTPEHNRQVAYTAQTVYMIPAKEDGTPYTLAPGASIKIVDQAQNFVEAGGIDNTDADFEWYDVVNSTNANALDTDNPDVPNLDKVYSYSATKWIANQQCNRSYVLFRLPEGMDKETFLADYAGYYEYNSPVNGNLMSNSKCMRVPNEWIIDGVNLSNSAVFVHGWVADAIDMSYVNTSDLAAERYDHKAQRRVASTVDGRDILMDTNDSLMDFVYVSYK